jgi:hypothetical protein
MSCVTASGTDQEKWEQIYGTTAYGNLPQDKKQEDEGHGYAPCPYSTQCPDVRSEIMITATPPYARTDHTGVDGRVYHMKTWARGNSWGFECTFDNCTYYLAEGKRYFWI